MRWPNLPSPAMRRELLIVSYSFRFVSSSDSLSRQLTARSLGQYRVAALNQSRYNLSRNKRGAGGFTSIQVYEITGTSIFHPTTGWDLVPVLSTDFACYSRYQFD